MHAFSWKIYLDAIPPIFIYPDATLQNLFVPYVTSIHKPSAFLKNTKEKKIFLIGHGKGNTVTQCHASRLRCYPHRDLFKIFFSFLFCPKITILKKIIYKV